MDERGEVGMLTRNIKLQASADAEQSFYGGHVMAMVGSKMFVEGVELNRMGQNMTLARYPIHWHLIGDAQGPVSYTHLQSAIQMKRLRPSGGRRLGEQDRRQLRVLYQDDAVVILNKPAKMLAVPTDDSDLPSALSLLSEELKSKRQRAFRCV